MMLVTRFPGSVSCSHLCRLEGIFLRGVYWRAIECEMQCKRGRGETT
jgi:hypothetical protein